jgi:hypothetical protein
MQEDVTINKKNWYEMKKKIRKEAKEIKSQITSGVSICNVSEEYEKEKN